MEPFSSASSSGSSSISRLPRFTPQRSELLVPRTQSTSSTPRNPNPPDFKVPKHPSVQALSLAIKKRYSSGRKVPAARGSPTVRAAPGRKPVTSCVLGKRTAVENNVGVPKKPRILGENNRPPAARRPGIVPAKDINKASSSKKTNAKSNVKQAASQENSDTAGGPTTSNTTSQKRKVQPWDLRGRLEVAQETIQKLKEDLDLEKNRVKELEELGGSAEERLSTLTRDLAEERALSVRLSESIAQRDSRIEALEEEKSNLAAANQRYLNVIAARDERIAALDGELAGLRRLCEDKISEIHKLEDLRKILHNTVQDLKGNIRVLCRVRPPTPQETSKLSPLCHIQYNDQTSMEIYKLKEDVNAKKRTSTGFSFDRIFPANSTQEDVYSELEQLVQSCLDGFNVCVFAYGQTGSGKTFTMDGEDDPESHRGMIPRTVHTIFNQIDKLKQLGWEYSVKVFFVEIYNEQIHDLLNYNSGLQHEVRMVPNKKGDVFVSNLRVETVGSQQELNDLMALARNNRFVASTVCNTHSSRSHFIMKMTVDGVNSGRQLTCSGSISLVDLAGSERYEDNNSVDRRKETMSINKSLSSLANVIIALKQKNDHVPYRVSKLTHLLMPCLGGSSKTLMIVNISPLKECYLESVNSLRFANCVNQCQVVAKKNEKTTATL